MRRRRTALSRSMELSIAAPAVIAMRVARMAAVGATPTAADRRENTRMVTEKVQAFGESWVAAALAQQQALVRLWVDAMRAAWLAPWTWASGAALGPAHRRRSMQRLLRANERIVERSLAPLQRTASANARRLARRRTR